MSDYGVLELTEWLLGAGVCLENAYESFALRADVGVAVDGGS